jgi:release factor glutamine methyltransferase
MRSRQGKRSLSRSDLEQKIWTIADVLRFATEDFTRRSISTARLDAELLLTHVLRIDRVRLVIDSRKPLSKEELERYRALIARRRKGEPIAYILGQREFMGHQFKTDARALIPRPDTETLVEVALRRTEPRNLFARSLDLCTGTGCVALSLLLARKTWRVTATDLSEAALALAAENAQRLGALQGLRLLQGDLFAALPEVERFELITSNPPYIRREAMADLDVDVRDFEPHLALDGGADGLDFYRRLTLEAPRYLVAGGILAVEVGFDQADDVATLFARSGFEELEKTRDFAGIERVVSGKFRPAQPTAPAT